MCDSKARPPLIRGEPGGMTNDVLFSNAKHRGRAGALLNPALHCFHGGQFDRLSGVQLNKGVFLGYAVAQFSANLSNSLRAFFANLNPVSDTLNLHSLLLLPEQPKARDGQNNHRALLK